MKRIFVLLNIILFAQISVLADNDALSKQATAFYSDNNRTKTMDLILQINENERTAQDWLLLGNVSADNGQPENALYMYQKAAECDKKYYKAYYNIANYYAEKGQLDYAVKYYQKALNLKKDNPYIFYNLACVYIAKSDFNKAKTNLNKAILLKSDIPEFHYNLAFVYKNLRKDKLAQTYLDNYNKLKEH